MAAMTAPVWRTPEELVTLGLDQARVLLMNEAHSGARRCVRTRLIGQRVLLPAHVAGVRHMALEALYSAFAADCNRTRQVATDGRGYLAQPEMQTMLEAALALGWTLWAYEADLNRWLAKRHGLTLPLAGEGPAAALGPLLQPYQAELRSQDFVNWREEEQARNLTGILATLPDNAKLLVWCGNGHLTKIAMQGWLPMGYHLSQQGVAPFAIDQTRTVNFGADHDAPRGALVERFRADLEARGGTAGWLSAEAPADAPPAIGADAVLLSLDNEME